MSTILVNTLSGTSTAGSIAVTGEGNSTTTNLQQGLAKAWLNVDVSSNIDDSFNIASVTDNGTGDNTYTFSSNMASANFAAVGIIAQNNAEIVFNNSRATSTFVLKIQDGTDGATAREREHNGVVHGDLA